MVEERNGAEDRYFTDRKSDTPRKEFERDRDRLLYSDAFRRLSGVTQVVRSEEAYPFHTRLTHSLKVAQVGRRVAQYINRNADTNAAGGNIVEPDVVETACLAHDLGHPPFGHAAEDELNYQIQEHGADDGFEGNAQSFRIVNRVETNALYLNYERDKGRGLNLTRASLNAILKYPWPRDESLDKESLPHAGINTDEKFGYYETEEDWFEWVRECEGSDQECSHSRSPEAWLMDWADDVTYAVHDLVDFYKAGLIPLSEILQETAEQEDFIDHFIDKKKEKITPEFDPQEFVEGLKERGLVTSSIKRTYEANRKTDAAVDNLQSGLIEDYLKVPQTVSIDPDTGKLVIDPKKRSQVEFLKELTFHYVIDNPALMGQQQGQRRVIATLFDAFLAATDKRYDSQFGKLGKYETKTIPTLFLDDLKGARDRATRTRYIADAITSLTERQAVQLYKRITGHVPGSLKEQIIS